MRLKVTTLWRLLQGLAVALLVAAAIESGIPYPDYCKWCEDGSLPWWLCVLNGCVFNAESVAVVASGLVALPRWRW